MRGEDAIYLDSQDREKELPPHVRRRERIKPLLADHDGITSACAEKRRPDRPGVRR